MTEGLHAALPFECRTKIAGHFMDVFIFKPTNEFHGKFCVQRIDEVLPGIEAFLKNRGLAPIGSYVEAAGKVWTVTNYGPLRIEEGRIQTLKSNSEQSTAQSLPPAFAFEVMKADGTTQTFLSLKELRGNIVSGNLRRTSSAKYRKATDYIGNAEPLAEYRLVSDICTMASEIRELFRPISASTRSGILYGILTATLLKAVDTTIGCLRPMKDLACFGWPPLLRFCSLQSLSFTQQLS
jgi:hypothetical protein